MRKLLLLVLSFLLVFTLVEVNAKDKVKVKDGVVKVEKGIYKDFKKGAKERRKNYPDFEDMLTFDYEIDGDVIDLSVPYTTLMYADATLLTMTTVSPYSGVAFLEVIFDDGGSLYAERCTGFFIDEDTLLTNAHCLEHDTLGYAVDVYVRPGAYHHATLNGLVSPYGTSYASEMFIDGAYNGSADYDFAIVNTEQKFNTIHTFDLTTSANSGMSVTTAGYPKYNELGKTSMWKVQGSVSSVYTRYIRYSSLHAVGGQSGSPIWGSNGDVQGIVSKGYPYVPGRVDGYRIRTETLTLISNFDTLTS